MRAARFLPALLLGVVFAVATAYGGLATGSAAVVNEAAAVIPTSCLQKKISAAEAEAAYTRHKDDRVARFPDAAKPFGFRHAQWEELKAAMIPGDENLDLRQFAGILERLGRPRRRRAGARRRSHQGFDHRDELERFPITLNREAL